MNQADCFIHPQEIYALRDDDDTRFSRHHEPLHIVEGKYCRGGLAENKTLQACVCVFRYGYSPTDKPPSYPEWQGEHLYPWEARHAPML